MATRILVVEDSRAMRDFVVATLESAWGAEVATAGTGIEALKALAQGPWDAVVVDIHVPDISGIELIRMLRGQAANRNAVVLAMSTDGSPVDIERAMAAGADGYLVKPFQPEELVGRLTELGEIRTPRT